jgi:PadR family transcriptional regulator, regulatory protein PadR
LLRCGSCRWTERDNNELAGTLLPSVESEVLAIVCSKTMRVLQTPDIFVIIELMRRREYLGQLELMVLLAVMRPGSDAYGVLIARDIADKSGREVALASVYAALERLEQKGFLSSSLGQPTAERGGKARTYFKATAAGIREAREAHATLLRLSAGLPALNGETA